MIANFSVLKVQSFAKYFTAQFLSALGNGMQFVAMSWLLFKLTGSVASMGWFLVVTSLPSILFSPWIGVLVDRWNIKTICVVADFVRGGILLCLATAVYFDNTPTWLIYLSEFTVVCCNSFYQPAAGILVRSVVPQGRLLAANSVRSMGVQIGILLGAAIGGVLIASFGSSLVILINVLSFIFSGLLTIWIRNVVRSANPAAQKTKIGFRREFMEAVQYMRRDHYLIWLAVIQASVYLTLYVCNTLLPAFTNKELAVGVKGFGLIDSSWAAGAILAGFLLTSIVKLINPRQFLSVSLFSLAFALLVFLNAQGLAQAMLGYFMIGFMTSSMRVNTDTVIQMSVDPQYLGRVTTTINMLISYSSLAVYLGVGYLGDSVSVRLIYSSLCCVVFTAGVMSLIFVRRAFEEKTQLSS